MPPISTKQQRRQLFNNKAKPKLLNNGFTIYTDPKDMTRYGVTSRNVKMDYNASAAEQESHRMVVID